MDQSKHSNVVLTKEDDQLLSDQVRQGFGPDRLYPYFASKYSDFTLADLTYAIRRLGLAGLRDGQGDATTATVNAGLAQ